MLGYPVCCVQHHYRGVRAMNSGFNRMLQRRLIPLSQVGQYLGLAGQIRNGAGFEFFGS